MTGPAGPAGPARPAGPAGPARPAGPAGSQGAALVPTAASGAGSDFEQRDEEPFEAEPRDWAWVEEWRETREPMPWGPGLAIAGFTAFLVASAVYVLSSGLSSRPLLAIAVNVVVVAGLCPALWLSRGLPVLRWIAGGAAAGVLAAWLCVLVFLV